MRKIGRRTFIKNAAAAALHWQRPRSPRRRCAQDAWPSRTDQVHRAAGAGRRHRFHRARGRRGAVATLGQQVVVENRTGAGGTIGMDLAMKSPPDGYTVLITNDNAASAPHIMSLSYDYTKELLPVCYLGRQSQMLWRCIPRSA